MTSSHHPPRKGRRAALALFAATVAGCASPAAALAGGSFTVQAHFPNHTPIANKPWKITLDVSKGKTKLSGSVKYDFEFGSTVVSHQPGHAFKKGVYKDSLKFTSPAVGQPLTLVVLVTTKYGTKAIDWAVKTQQ